MPNCSARRASIRSPVASAPGRSPWQRPRQPIQPTGRGDQPALHLRQAEGGRFRGHHQVAGERDLRPAGQRRAVHGGDPQLRARREHEPGEAAALGPEGGAASGGDLLQVGAGAEGTRPRRRSAPRPRSPGPPRSRRRPPPALRDGAVDGIARRGAVDRDQRDVRAGALEQHAACSGPGLIGISSPAARPGRRGPSPRPRSAMRSSSSSSPRLSVSSAGTRAISRAPPPSARAAITTPWVGAPSRSYSTVKVSTEAGASNVGDELRDRAAPGVGHRLHAVVLRQLRRRPRAAGSPAPARGAW